MPLRIEPVASESGEATVGSDQPETLIFYEIRRSNVPFSTDQSSRNIMAQIPSPPSSITKADGEVGTISAAGGAGFVRCASCSFSESIDSPKKAAPALSRKSTLACPGESPKDPREYILPLEQYPRRHRRPDRLNP